jgi:hypothetical protein
MRIRSDGIVDERCPDRMVRSQRVGRETAARRRGCARNQLLDTVTVPAADPGKGVASAAANAGLADFGVHPATTATSSIIVAPLSLPRDAPIAGM